MTKTVWMLGAVLALATGCDDGDPDPMIIGVDGTVGAGGQGGGAGGQGGGQGGQGGGQGGQGGGAGGQGGQGGGAGGQGGGAGGQGGGQGGQGGGAGGQGGGQGGQGGGMGGQGGASEDTDALCSDQIDNDGDGYFDCDDFDCSRNNAVTVCDPVCQPDCDGRTCGPDGCGGTCGPGCADGELCADGRCTAEGCPDGTFECGNVCSRLTDDPDNCGSCGSACDRADGALSQCIAAECYLNCPGMEGQARNIDFQNDPANCGRCGNACPGAEGGEPVCIRGECGNPCPGGQTPCGGVCVNLNRNDDNCGRCGNACEDGMICRDGGCACPDGSEDLRGDPRNCGRCGNICDDTRGGSGSCEAGQCGIECFEAEDSVCAMECANLQSDPDHCGACDTPCPDEEALPGAGGLAPVTGRTCTTGDCTYTLQRTERLSRGDNQCDLICASRGLVCDDRIRQIRTCTNARGRVYEKQNAEPGVGCFMFYSTRDDVRGEHRFAVAPSCDANIWDFGFNTRLGFSFDRNAVNCNCIAAEAVDPEPDPMPEPMPEPEPDVQPPGAEINRPGTYNRPGFAANRSDTLTLAWPNAAEVRLATRGPNNGDCPADTTLAVFRGAERIAFNDDADDVCSVVTVNVQAGEELRVEVAGYNGRAIPAYSVVASGELEGPPPVGEQTLLISEYVEGSGQNKVLELYNHGDAVVSLEGCVIDRYSNGGADPFIIRLDGAQIPAGGTFVLCKNEVESAACNQRSGSLNHNGDDTLALRCGDIVLDVFGRIGEDPGDGWGAGQFTTNNHTLRRNCNVQMGDANGRDAFDPAAEWSSFPIDTLDGLGAHCP